MFKFTKLVITSFTMTYYKEKDLHPVFGWPAEKLMRQNVRGGLHQFPTPLLNLFSFSQVTQEARLAVKWPCRLSCAGYCKHANISMSGSRKFRKGWPGHLPAK